VIDSAGVLELIATSSDLRHQVDEDEMIPDNLDSSMASDAICSESSTARAPEQLEPSVLRIDCAAETARIAARLVKSSAAYCAGAACGRRFGRHRQLVCAALAARAFGRERVLALLLPEHDSSRESTRLGRLVAEH